MTSILAEAIKTNDYVVVHTISGLVYAGRALGYDDSFKLIILEYRNGSDIKTTDVYLPNILSIQRTTLEKIEKMRNERRLNKKT
jgi:hypothetical protein